MGTNEQHLANNNPAVQGSSLNYQNWAGPSNDFDIQAPFDTVWKFKNFSASHILRQNDEKYSIALCQKSRESNVKKSTSKRDHDFYGKSTFFRQIDVFTK